MISAVLKKTIFISLLCHITLFGIFSFSFGKKIPVLNFSSVFFLGAHLRNFDLTPGKIFVKNRSPLAFNKLNNINKKSLFVAGDYLKPVIALSFNKDKLIFEEKSVKNIFLPKKRAQPIMFYPRLPSYFSLYFKNRQVVHIELMYNIVRHDRLSPYAIIKRKISSGNLEVDLLSMRYISRYLFMQRVKPALDEWQTVKIDFSSKSD